MIRLLAKTAMVVAVAAGSAAAGAPSAFAAAATPTSEITVHTASTRVTAQADSADSARSVTATCVYHVRYNWTPVQENPDTDSVVRKYKFAGARVTSPCWAVYDTEGGTWFTAVYCGCASDGIGWIRSYWLY